MLDLKEIIHVSSSIEDFYKKSTDNPICIKYAEITHLIVKISKCCYLLYMIFLALFSIQRILILHTPMLTMILPGTDMTKNSHLFLMCIWHSAYIVVGCLVVCLFDTVIYIIFVNTLMVSLIIKQNIEKFESNLGNGLNCCKEIKSGLLNIILMHHQFMA